MSSWYTSPSQTSRSQTSQKMRPSISKPTSTSDCNIMITRNKNTQVENSNSITDLNALTVELQKKITDLQNQMKKVNEDIASLKQTQSQSVIDEKYLLKWAEELKLRDEKNAEALKWKEFISQNEIPHDAFNFTKINNSISCPIDQLTNDEIVKIGKYTKASVLVQESDVIKQKTGSTYDTYGELYDDCDEEYDSMIIGSVHGCNSNSEDSDSNSDCDDCCHKRYAYTLSDFNYVELDDTDIVSYSRIN